MKKIIFAILIVIALATFGCEHEAKLKNYVTLSGKILNRESDSIQILNLAGKLVKTIPIAEDGSFVDTLKLKEKASVHKILNGTKTFFNFLDNGYDLNLTVDLDDVKESLRFEGIGEEENNFLLQGGGFFHVLPIEEKDYELEPDEFSSLMENAIETLTDNLENTPGLDSTFIALQKQYIPVNEHHHFLYYGIKNLDKILPKGEPAPKFKDYENYLGGTTSMEDFLGKHVYIDFWATWCVPCIAEFPYLKKLKDKYGGKVDFVGISLDYPSDKERWREFLEKEALETVQVFSDEGFGSQIVKDYRIPSIPRFVFIDPEGNIVDPNAPRPSEEALITKLFDENLD
ncbi:TlpA family protein disulfide reductase [Flagellimonas hymeniacidonis]|uniref:TlpA family protein disulfide reductase n=1 Tax=Flagellimonas hymeniacidonis TaxID=2603628 RepID=A0A5C8UZN4_9FLAO|nr:TlpA disulfide reductase family protein [Flagellimonas hymeniacidonis]TXN34973.1 TlpA family protein disulfide reductase [Flagellimonas hymeniacidonis]